MKDRVVEIVDLFVALPIEEKAIAFQLMRTKAKENWESDAKAAEAQMCRLKELNELFFRS